MSIAHQQKRMVTSNIWIDEVFCELKDRQKILYIGLITYADDYGRFSLWPALVKRNIFWNDASVDIKTVDSLIQDLLEVGIICNCGDEKAASGHHSNWIKYQTLDQRRLRDSEYPEPVRAKCVQGARKEPAQDKLSEDKEIEGKKNKEKSDSDTNQEYSQIKKAYENIPSDSSIKGSIKKIVEENHAR